MRLPPREGGVQSPLMVVTTTRGPRQGSQPFANLNQFETLVKAETSSAHATKRALFQKGSELSKKYLECRAC